MRPTKEIIELAKKLYKLGYKQEKHFDTWMISNFDKKFEWVDLASNITARDTSLKRISIPSLKDGLEWLRKRSRDTDVSLDWDSADEKWNCCFTQWKDNPLGDIEIHTDSRTDPLVATLKAMIEVLESKED